MSALTVLVQVAFASDPDDATPTWTDVSAYARLDSGISINRGRTDQFSTTSPATCTLTLDNSDGRFTAGRTGSPYFPNVQLGKRIRVQVTDGTTTWTRFEGLVDSWPVQFSPAGSKALAPITAVDRFSRLQTVGLQNVIANEILQDSPVAYYQLGDAAGSTTALGTQDSITPEIAQVVGGVTFGSATGPGTDGITAAQFAALGYIDMPVTLSASSSWSLEAFIVTSVAASGNDVPFLVLVDSTGALGYAFVTGLGSGALGVSMPGVSGGSGFVNDGLTHHVVVQYDHSTGKVSTYLDGVSTYTSTLTSTGLGAVSRLLVGGRPPDVGGRFDPYVGTIAHVALYSSVLSATRIAQHALAGSTGFAGELSSARVARVCGYAGVAASEIVTETGQATMAALAPSGSALDELRNCETAENGALFISTDGKVTFQSRTHRYNMSTTATLPAGSYDPDLSPILDNFGLVNDVTVDRGNGTMAFHAADATSIAARGRYTESLSLLVDTDAQTRDRAGWEVITRMTPVVRWPKVTVDVLTQPSVRTAVFACDVGSRLTLTGLPSTAPASSVDVIAEGYTETISLDTHALTFNCSNYFTGNVLTLNSATTGQLDSDVLAL